MNDVANGTVANGTLLNGLPPLEWTHGVGSAEVLLDGDALLLTAAAGTDWTNDPLGGPAQHASTALGFPAPESFTLSARATVRTSRTTFDAAVLTLWGDSEHWAKVCFEYSPQGEAMVVSVVTNGFSDDCNSEVVTDASVYLRVTRTGSAWAFHSSVDGRVWRFVRVFRLDWTGPVSAGFMAQAPMGDTCEALFDSIVFSPHAVADLRDGS